MIYTSGGPVILMLVRAVVFLVLFLSPQLMAEVISGTVKRASTGQAVVDVRVVIAGTTGPSPYVAWTSSSGAYQATVPPGEYRVYTYDADFEELLNQVYAGRHCVQAAMCTWDETQQGQIVKVVAGNNVSGIDFSLLDQPTISGTVRLSDGSPLPGRITVEIKDSENHFTQTDANGAYSEKLPPGSYSVRVNPGQGYNGVAYPNTPCPTYPCSGGTPVQVTTAPVSGIDLVLQVTTARIQGTIRDRKGKPFSGIQVAPVDGFGQFGVGTTTDAAGRYTLRGLGAGRIYVRALDELHGQPNVDCKYRYCSVQGATPFDLTAGSTTTVDMQLHSERSVFTGRVSKWAVGGPGVKLDELWAFDDRNGYHVTWDQELKLKSNADGTYSLSFISRENAFYLRAYAAGVGSSMYPNVPADCGWALRCFSVDAKVVEAGVRSGIDIVLDPHGVISGVVTDALTGERIAGVAVHIAQNGNGVDSTTTDANGKYRWIKADGSYQVYVPQTNAYVGQVFLGLDCIGDCDSRVGKVVTALPGQERTSIDFRLSPFNEHGRITGRVVDDKTGEGLANVLVRAWSSRFSGTALTDARGYYANESLPADDYRVTAEIGSYFTSVYGGAQCAETIGCAVEGGALLRVIASNTMSGIDFRLIRVHATTVTPSTGPATGGTWITIAGSNFAPGSKVRVGGVEAQLVSVNPKVIVAVTPPGSPGAADVTVSVSATQSATILNGFTYLPGSSRRRTSRH